jgi:hypothetical protein
VLGPEAADLWLLAGEAQAALEAARRAQRGDLVATIASDLGWHAQAAQAYIELAQKARGSDKAAPYWAAAAVAWDREGQEAEAARCRLEDARARQAPLLTLTAANLPQLQLGQPDVVQVRIANLAEAPAHAVTLAYHGPVRRADERSLANIGPRAERIEEIAVVPTQSGSATLEITVRYADARGQPQTPVDLDVRLQVARPPEVHHHYYGPVIGGDGVIIMRGERGRHLRVQDGGEALELGAQARCPHCGATIQPDDRFCNQCRAELTG